MAGHTPLFHNHFDLVRPRELVDRGQVNAQNAAEARYYVDDSGRRWVGKHETQTGIESVLAEATSWFLAKETGVRIPDAGYVGSIDDDSFIWLSEYVSNTVHWEPRYANFVANDGEVAAMLILDAVTMNEDRHPLNVLVVPQDETVLQLWAIDFGNARLSYIDDFCQLASDVLPRIDHRTIRGLPIGRLRQVAEAAALRFEEFAANRPELIDLYARTACGLVNEDEAHAESLSAALKSRMRNARSLITRYLQAFEDRP